MALTPEEIKIVEYGKAQGKSQDEVSAAISRYRLNPPAAKPQEQQSTVPVKDISPLDGLKEIAGAAKEGVDKFATGFKQTQEAVKTGEWSKLGRGILNEAGGGLETAFSPITGVLRSGAKIPGISNVLGLVKKYAIEAPADEISEFKPLQEFMTKYPHADEVAQNLITIGLSLFGGKEEVKTAATDALENAAGKAKKVFSPAEEIQVYHGTTPEAAASIKKSGFDISKARGGATEPEVINFTGNADEALKYAKGNSEGVVTSTLRGKNIARFNSGEEYIKAVEGKFGDYTGSNATKFLKQYDGVVVKGRWRKWCG
jgi:hypothetical protein